MVISNVLNRIFLRIKNFFLDFIRGNLFVKLSYFIMGIGQFFTGQIVRGLIYLFLQVSYWAFMVSQGFFFISKLDNLGDFSQGEVWDPVEQIYRVVPGENSMLILLFGVMTIVISIVMLMIYFKSIKNSVLNQKLKASGKKINSFKDDLNELRDEKFHVTVLSFPVLSITLLTVIPIIFMILLAFTNYDRNHLPPGNLFTWVGLENFKRLFMFSGSTGNTFFSLLTWTIIWAVAATFLNYIFGMILAIVINKKGIKLKQMWRTIFVMTIAVPQFVSLLLMSKLLADNGALNSTIALFGGDSIPFLTNGTVAKFTVIIVNLWVGIPYTMLSTTGILMNIPQDLYESANIDGANASQQFFKITLPYMLHVTTPYLITQFIGNINNFNVIFLLTGGGPLTLDYFKAGETDLLVTWLYKLTVNEQEFALASAIGIVVFIISAGISLVAFNKSSAMQKEDQFK